MLKKIGMSVLVALFTFGLAGYAVAEDDYPNYEQGNITHQEMADTHDVKSNVAPEDSATDGSIDQINPLFCTEDLVQENNHIAANTCTEEDLFVQGG
jgi:hypothetical protein